MAYQCPRCGGPVKRGGSTAAGVAGGAAGALIFGAFAPFECKTCGKIPSEEFPPDVRAKMRNGSIVMILVALLLFTAVILLVVKFHPNS